MRKTPLLVIHCSATPPAMDIGAAEIRQWHTDPEPDGNGWADIGYHYVIRRSGKVEPGRDLSRAGAHAAPYNRYSIGVCLVGGVDKHGQPADNFTKVQYSALVKLVRKLRAEHDIVSVVGHRDLPGVAKACPSFDVAPWVYHNL